MPERKARPKGPELADGVVLQLALPSDSSLLCVVRATVARLAVLLKFSDADCRSITRAVDEAMTNILRHSYKGRRDRPIALEFRRLQRGPDTGIEVLLWDELRPLDNQLRPGGLGLHFIRQAMGTVKFSRVGDQAKQVLSANGSQRPTAGSRSGTLRRHFAPGPDHHLASLQKRSRRLHFHSRSDGNV